MERRGERVERRGQIAERGEWKVERWREGIELGGDRAWKED